MRTSIASTIEFGAGGNGRHCLVAGWYPPEPGATWAAGTRSVLSIAAPFAPNGYFLEIDWIVQLSQPATPAQTVRISVDGQPIYNGAVGRNGMAAFLCPPPRQGAERLTITIEHPDMIQPSQRFGGEDQRTLSLALRRLRVLPAEQTGVSTPVYLARTQIQGSEPATLVREAERVAGVGLADMFGAFEAVSGNCDMGLAMRVFGFESLSLLKFGGTTPTTAIRLLETRFAGLGDELQADVADNPEAEWMVDDATGLRFHSGQSSRTVSAPDLLAKFGPQLRRLADKLLEDVAADGKIFVYSDHVDLNVTRGLEAVLPLYLALRRMGSNRLLWVCPAGRDSPLKGSAAVVLPGLVQAHLEILAQPLTRGGDITLPGWMTVLVNAWMVFAKLAGQEALKDASSSGSA